MLEAFYKDNYRIVYGFLLSLCGDPNMAEDLAAETFCKAIEQIKKYDPKYKASTWLCAIGKNLFLNECRRKKRFAGLDEAEWIAVPSAESIHLQKEEAGQVLEKLKNFRRNKSRCLSCACRECRLRRSGLPWEKVKTGPE